jgi:hypothetical protein
VKNHNFKLRNLRYEGKGKTNSGGVEPYRNAISSEVDANREHGITTVYGGNAGQREIQEVSRRIGYDVPLKHVVWLKDAPLASGS